MVVALVALVMASTGVTYAVHTAPRNSVNSSSIVNNSIRSGDIRSGNVRSSDIATNGVRSSDVGPDALTGEDIAESSLGKVPSAQSADSASTLGGRTGAEYINKSEVVPFRVALNFGETRTVVSRGPVSLEVECRENINADGHDQVRLLARTTEPGAFMQGDDDHSGPGVGSDNLTPETPADNREIGSLTSTTAGEGQPAVDDSIDQGFVFGPGGQYIGIDESMAYALRVGTSACLIVGYATVE